MHGKAVELSVGYFKWNSAYSHELQIAEVLKENILALIGVFKYTFRLDRQGNIEILIRLFLELYRYNLMVSSQPCSVIYINTHYCD